MSKIIKEDLIIESSAIEYATYYHRSKMLFVFFTNANAYEYYNVERFVWEGLRAAPSAGSFLNGVIKNLNLDYKKVSL